MSHHEQRRESLRVGPCDGLEFDENLVGTEVLQLSLGPIVLGCRR